MTSDATFVGYMILIAGCIVGISVMFSTDTSSDSKSMAIKFGWIVFVFIIGVVGCSFAGDVPQAPAPTVAG